jgi:hypothetical protein
MNYNPPVDLKRFQGIAIGVGLIGLIFWAVLVVMTGGNAGETFFRTYLVAYTFWCGIALGCLGWLMIQYLGGATWGIVIRRLLESGSHTLFLMFVLFVPIALGVHHIYEWADAEAVAGSRVLQHKSSYLNTGFFAVRTLIYFIIWLTMFYYLRRWSHRQDETGDPAFLQYAHNLSGPGFVFYGLACTFAGIDWIMSLDPEWYSTIFGLIMIAGQGVSAMAFIISVCVILSRWEPMSHVLQPKHFHDLGKLLLALVMVWAYFSFSQLLIMWSGNLPEEIPWYLERFKGNWRYMGIGLILLYFFLPFFLLLSRDLKRNSRRLVVVAWLIIVMRFVDLLWMIVPEFEHGHAVPVSGYLIYLAATIGIGGIWLGWFFWQLRQRALLPVNDPQLAEALAARGHH